MALDRSKLHKGYQSYLTNAEKTSGKTYEDMTLVLSKSSLKSHGELRSHLMEKMGIGHGHANAVVHIWREFGEGDVVVSAGKSPPIAPIKKAPTKKAPAKKAAVKKAPARKTPAKKPAAS